MNDRYRNVCKAHDHIVKCRTKEGKRIFIPRWGICGSSIRQITNSKNKKNYI